MRSDYLANAGKRTETEAFLVCIDIGAYKDSLTDGPKGRLCALGTRLWSLGSIEHSFVDIIVNLFLTFLCGF